MAQKFVCARKRLDWFKEGKNERQRPESILKPLGRSLRIRQVNPVVARSDGTVVDGWSRVLAARMEGLEELDVIITDEQLTESDMVIAQWVSAEYRSGLTDGERWRKACELMTMNMWEPKDLGAALSLEPSATTILLSPCRCCKPVQDALLAGQISLSVCYSISKAGNAAEEMEFLNRYLNGATRKDLDEARKQKKAEAKPAKRGKRLKLETESLVLSITGEFTLFEVGTKLVEIGKHAIRAAGQGVEPSTYQRLFADEMSFKRKETSDATISSVVGECEG